MSNPKSVTTDRSMDDILASIRKIISDDEARAEVDRQQVNSADPGTARREHEHGDVLLLTDLVEEPQPEAGQAGEPGDGSLLGAAAAAAATQALGRLNQTVLSITPMPSTLEPGPEVTAGGKTLEDLVKELLRPMLKDWLDRNLPALVERYVEREVIRLTRR